jgi:mRNA-degrading endonuclease RelE of RelBE toxin-antitoxin system
LIDETARNPDAGKELEDEWAGARGIRFEKATYRLIWEVDYKQELVIVLRVGKKLRRSGTIYELPRPTTKGWPPDTRG